MPVICIEDIAHVRFCAPDLAQMARFLGDFGLDSAICDNVLYARGSDGRAYIHMTERGPARFAGLGLRAASLDDLARLAEAEGVAMVPSPRPGGGMIVTLTDPDGFVVEVVAGQARAAPQPAPAPPLRNCAAEAPRLRAATRIAAGPAHVRRIGHCVLRVRDFRVSEAWYKARFGFLTSDAIEAAPGVAMGAFMRCDRGALPSDHHTLFLAQLPGKPGFMHAAFEVAHLDDLMAGHDHLAAHGYRAAWGVGRHVLGSQVFDYWLDPWGHELEHWTDGDLYAADDAPRTADFATLLAVQWGARNPMVAARFAPPAGLIGRLIGWRIAIARRFGARRHDPEGAIAR